jgi:phosphomannomutase/phosphoglucomutase
MSDSPSPRLFGTDGVRGVVGSDYTPGFVSDLACALAHYLNREGPILVAWDFRTTSPGISHILAGALQMNGVDVVEMGEMPTPTLQFNVKAVGARGGLMVTASHNPTEFNGIKFSGPDGLELRRDAEVVIEEAVHQRTFPSTPWDRAGVIRSDPMGIDRYTTSIQQHVDRRAIRQLAARVALDCGNGTSAVTSPRLLRELGCKVSTLNANPDGHFPGHPSEPTDDNLTDLKRAVVQSGALLGIAHDGDSDRVAFIDEKGRYVPGEEALALFARYSLAPDPHATIVTAVTSTSCVTDVVAQAGGNLVITRSGSLPVAEGIRDNRAVFGGEENGGYYWPSHQIARDGPMSSAKMLEVLARLGRPLSELVAELPRYTVLKTRLPLARGMREVVMAHVRGVLAAEAERLVTIDGVKAFYHDGWLLVRPSGTEPLVRIFAESRDPERARELQRLGVELVVSRTSGHPPSSSGSHTAA